MGAGGSSACLHHVSDGTGPLGERPGWGFVAAPIHRGVSRHRDTRPGRGLRRRRRRRCGQCAPQRRSTVPSSARPGAAAGPSPGPSRTARRAPSRSPRPTGRASSPSSTTLTSRQTRTFTETVTTKPTSPLTLEAVGEVDQRLHQHQLRHHPGREVHRQLQHHHRPAADDPGHRRLRPGQRPLRPGPVRALDLGHQPQRQRHGDGQPGQPVPGRQEEHHLPGADRQQRAVPGALPGDDRAGHRRLRARQRPLRADPDRTVDRRGQPRPKPHGDRRSGPPVPQRADRPDLPRADRQQRAVPDPAGRDAAGGHPACRHPARRHPARGAARRGTRRVGPRPQDRQVRHPR